MSIKNTRNSDVVQCWRDIDFKVAENHVKKLKKRISVAWQDGAFGKVGYLQHRMVNSFYSKVLAVKVVYYNRGKYTSGVDNVIWRTAEDLWNAVGGLSRRGYKPKPLKRVYIPKADGNTRPLSIPTMRDRATQTLWKFALEPIAEITADTHSYGFRTGRSTLDALIRCGRVLLEHKDCIWILKADIEACFDNMSHDWIMEHIPMDKAILRKVLDSGYIENRVFIPTTAGIPQGGSLSAVLCNMVLDGLEKVVQSVCSDNDGKAFYTRFADDIVIIGSDRHFLINVVTPTVEDFLAERGLCLSEEKTDISHMSKGFDFLGWNMVMDIKRTLVITPSVKNLQSLLNKVKSVVAVNQNKSDEQLQRIIKPIICGWVNYHYGIVTPESLTAARDELVSLLKKLPVSNSFVQFCREFFSPDKTNSALLARPRVEELFMKI